MSNNPAGAFTGVSVDPVEGRDVVRGMREVLERLRQLRARDARAPRPVPAGDEVSMAVARCVAETADTRDRVEDRGLRMLAQLTEGIERRIAVTERVDGDSADAIAARG